MTRPIASVALRLVLAGLLLALWSGLPMAADAQTLQYRPEKVRDLMRSIHGYTRADLDAASTNVDEILMDMAGDGAEQMFIRRQAIKGLRLYPTEPVLSFIEQHSAGAPEGMKRLYLSSAAYFAQAFPDRVRALAERELNAPSINVRFSALRLADALQQTPAVRSMLQARLAAESDAQLRAAIQQKLNAN